MVEFQSRVTMVEASIMAALKGAPFCLPPATYGVQMQSVHFERFRVAHDVPTQETILYRAWQEIDPHPKLIDTLQAQIIVRCNLGFVRVSTIHAMPNALPPAEANLKADIVMDFVGRV